MENLASERANVGANKSIRKGNPEFKWKIMTGEMAVGRIQDTDVATESTTVCIESSSHAGEYCHSCPS